GERHHMNFTGPDGIRTPASRGAMLRSGVSALAVCSILAAAPAYAQTQNVGTQESNSLAPPVLMAQAQPSNQSTSTSTSPQDTSSPGGAIIITGIRQSLKNAQQIKRNSDTVVDVITSQDIGALPDRSVTEALQRVPGVSINRFAGSSDP